MKKFKTKKKKKKIFKYIFIFLIMYLFVTKVLASVKIKSSNEEFIKYLLSDSNYLKHEQKDYFGSFTKYILNIDLKNPENILKNIFKYENKKENKNINTTYIENEIDTEPLVYIYNTHESEEYDDSNLKEYNITPNVKMASYLLSGLLKKENINSIVEEGSISEFLKNNNLDYNQSYTASRYYLTNILNKYPNLKLIIDLHRDAISKESSTVEIDGKNYAKVMFVIGKSNQNYEKNLELSKHLNDIILKKYPSLTRGVFEKESTEYNTIYNQDLAGNIILIECGGNENTIDEVMNTVIVLKDTIKEYIGEVNG